jgi:hypothetical protein
LENDEEAIALKTLLDDGYRWTQTTPEYAVFEKAEGGVRQTAREVIGLINDLHFGDGCRYSNARNVTCKACLAQDALAPLAGITPPLDEEEEGHERH